MEPRAVVMICNFPPLEKHVLYTYRSLKIFFASNNGVRTRLWTVRVQYGTYNLVYEQAHNERVRRSCLKAMEEPQSLLGRERKAGGALGMRRPN